jgi:hypothetical protein
MKRTRLLLDDGPLPERRPKLPPPPDYTEIVEDGKITIEPPPPDPRSSTYHLPTPYTKRQVELLKCYGLTHPAIAHVIGVSQGTLEKWYKEELEHGKHKTNAMIAHRLFDVALRGEGDSAVRAMIFWLKTRAGWSESLGHLQVQHEGRVEHEHYALSHEERAVRVLQVLNAGAGSAAGRAVIEHVRAMASSAGSADGGVPLEG